MKLKRRFLPKDIVREADSLEIAMFCYFGMSNKAIQKHLRHLSDSQIYYRIKKIREWYGINIHRSAYRDGENQLARHVISRLRPFAQKKLTLNDLR